MHGHQLFLHQHFVFSNQHFDNLAPQSSTLCFLHHSLQLQKALQQAESMACHHCKSCVWNHIWSVSSVTVETSLRRYAMFPPCHSCERQRYYMIARTLLYNFFYCHNFSQYLYKQYCILTDKNKQNNEFRKIEADKLWSNSDPSLTTTSKKKWFLMRSENRGSTVLCLCNFWKSLLNPYLKAYTFVSLDAWRQDTHLCVACTSTGICICK